MTAHRIAAVRATVVAAFLALAATALAADGDVRKILAPTGTLRAALYPGTPTSVLDPQASEPRGVGYELGKELARQLGVPYAPVIYPKNADVQEAIKAGAADVAFTNASPARRKIMDFGPPYLLIELGYLVPAGSSIAATADIDRTGRRVGVTAGSTTDAILSRDLKNADVVRAATNQDGADLLAAGRIDVFATNKATLFKLAEKLPGARVLADRWGEERHAIAIPQGRGQGAPFVKAFTEDAIARGLIEAAIGRAGLRGALVAGAK